jgi:hypothetical protein
MTSADALAGAQGKFAVFMASMFQRAGVASMQEFAELLAMFAETVADTDPDEAAILTRWALAIRGTAAS